MHARKLLIALGIALVSASAFAATTTDEGSSQTSATSAPRKWYEAGEIAIQQEQQRAALERQGFHQAD